MKIAPKITRLSPDDQNEYKIDIKDDLPLYVQLTNLIKRQISEKFWKLDEMIPSENELAATYNVSVGTVKKALSFLVDEGVLYRRQGKGTFISRPDFNRSFMRFFRYGADENQTGRDLISKVLSLNITYPGEKIKEALELEEKDKIIFIKRIRYLNDLPVMLQNIHLPYKIFKGFEKIDTSRKLLYPIYEEKFKTPVVWAEEELWPTIADHQAAEALEIKKGDPVISIERIVYTYGDKPIEFRNSVGRGDKFRYKIEIR